MEEKEIIEEVKEENTQKKVFEAITSQEQLDKIIKGRLEREKEKYSSRIEELENQVSTFGNKEQEYLEQIKSLKDSSSKSSDYEKKIESLKHDALKVKIALSNGLPFEMASRLQGKDEKELIDDAKSISKMMGTHVSSAPSRNPEANQTDGVMEAFRKLNPKIKI